METLFCWKYKDLYHLSKSYILSSWIFTGLPGKPSHKFGFRSSVQKNGLPGEGRHEGLVPRNDVLTSGFIWLSLARTLARILFVPRLRPPSRKPRRRCAPKEGYLRCSKRFDHRSHFISFVIVWVKDKSHLMMLALGNSEKCSRCIQTHTPFTVGSH